VGVPVIHLAEDTSSDGPGLGEPLSHRCPVVGSIQEALNAHVGVPRRSANHCDLGLGLDQPQLLDQRHGSDILPREFATWEAPEGER
jgi:hypothetical protein